MGVPLLWEVQPFYTPPGLGVIWALTGLKLALSSLLALITGKAFNSIWQQAPPLIWEVMNLMSPPIDGMASDKLSQSPPGEQCHSHTLHLPLQPLPLLLLSSFFKKNLPVTNLQHFAVCLRISYIFHISQLVPQIPSCNFNLIFWHWI